MNNVQIADVFDQIGDLLEVQDANPCRVRAYRNAARTIRDLPESAEEILADPNRNLTDISGIGKDLAEKIGVLVQTGTLPMLEELLEQVPRSVLAMLRVPGLGPKRAAALYHELGVSNLVELREACQQHKVRELKGFGAKTEEAILGGLEIASQAERRTYWAEADVVAQDILKHLRQCKAITKMEVAGSYRRKREAPRGVSSCGGWLIKPKPGFHCSAPLLFITIVVL